MDNERETAGNFTFTWTVENFIKENANEGIWSPVFIAHDGSRWNVYFSYDSKDFIYSCLVKRDEDDINWESLVDSMIEIINMDGNICYSRQFQNPKAVKSQGGIIKANQTSIKIDELFAYKKYTTFTIRWHTRSKDLAQMPQLDCIAKTTYGISRCSFEWKVKIQEGLQKRAFYFQLEKYELICTMRKTDFYIQIERFSDSAYCILGFTLSLLDTTGAVMVVQSSSCDLKTCSKILKLPIFVSMEKLNKRECIKNNVFTLMCEFFVSNRNNTSNIEYNCKKQVNTAIVAQDLQTMYVENILSDVKFRIGDEMLFGHKCILSMHSPVFRAMFNQELNEKQTGVVDIVDADSKIFSMFLKYFYTETIVNIEDEVNYQVVMKLIILADKYQVTRLVSLLSCVLASKIAQYNAFEILLTADAVQNSYLKDEAIRFIKKCAAFILSSDQWKEFIKNNIDLASEIITYEENDEDRMLVHYVGNPSWITSLTIACANRNSYKSTFT